MTEQYLRQISLVLADEAGNGLDLSAMKIKFAVKKSDYQTPNTCELRVYNLAESTMQKIQKEFTQIVLKAGYPGNIGLIFTGNIKQIFRGREKNTDNYLGIQSADGDKAYNFTSINKTLGPGVTQMEQVGAVIKEMNPNGVSAGFLSENLTGVSLPRGKVMFGMGRDYLRRSTQSSNTSFSVQDGKLQVVSLKQVLPNQAIVLNSKSGLIGTPEQTNKGIKVQCLLNPNLKVAGRIHLNDSDIQREKIGTPVKNGNANAPVAISSDGFYRLLTVTHYGDTREKDWYSRLLALDVDATAPEDDSVSENG